MIIDFTSIEPLQRYHLMTQTVIPRPIAWILSTNEDSSFNLAPFSYFTAVCSDPPLLVLSIGHKPDGAIKDTRHNILSGRDFVIHIASVAQAEALNISAAPLQYGESELATSGMELTDFPGCAVPRLKASKVAWHCRFYQYHELGPGRQAVIYAEICHLYLNDTVVEENAGRYLVDAQRVNPLCRLGGANYSGLGKTFAVRRSTSTSRSQGRR